MGTNSPSGPAAPNREDYGREDLWIDALVVASMEQSRVAGFDGEEYFLQATRLRRIWYANQYPDKFPPRGRRGDKAWGDLVEVRFQTVQELNRQDEALETYVSGKTLPYKWLLAGAAAAPWAVAPFENGSWSTAFVMVLHAPLVALLAGVLIVKGPQSVRNFRHRMNTGARVKMIALATVAAFLVFGGVATVNDDSHFVCEVGGVSKDAPVGECFEGTIIDSPAPLRQRIINADLIWFVGFLFAYGAGAMTNKTKEDEPFLPEALL